MTIYENTEIESVELVELVEKQLKVFYKDQVMPEKFDQVWLGTGSKLDITKEPLLQSLLDKHPIKVIDQSMPVLTETLRWDHNVPCHILGCYSCLVLGPGAHNLGGSMVGADRVVESLEAFLGQRCGIHSTTNANPTQPINPEFVGKTRKSIGFQGLYSVLNEMEA